MNEKDSYFEIFPRIVQADTESTINIRPLYDHCKLDPDKSYKVVFKALESVGLKNEPDAEFLLAPQNGNLRISLYFEAEQEHIIEVYEEHNSEYINYISFSVYSLEEDLFKRRPYKGDIHMHSYYSDGRESPAYIAAACRKIGFDFMTITDHGKYFPSIEAQKVYDSVDIDLKIFPGEEVHPPDNEVHIINFGGDFSVNELFKDKNKYKKEVDEIQETLDDELSDEDKKQYASCVWCFDKIRQGGGMGIYCHPFWLYLNRYNVSVNLNKYMFKNMPFDAYEVIGGFDTPRVDSNILQVAYYNEERSKGKKIPIVGVSDAHGCERNLYFGWFYTIIFSHGLELNDITNSIKGLFSVAVEALPDQSIRVHGPFRLVKFALFLIKEILPKHDDICFEEGKQMFKYLSQEDETPIKLESMSGGCAKLMERFFSCVN